MRYINLLTYLFTRLKHDRGHRHTQTDTQSHRRHWSLYPCVTIVSIAAWAHNSFFKRKSRLISYKVKADSRLFRSSWWQTCDLFSTRCNIYIYIYISRLCCARLSVRLSVTFVHCGHRMQWIPDIFACLDRWMSLLLTDNASPGSSDRMMPGFLVEEGAWKNW